MGKNDRNNLGQYFTPNNLAIYMTKEVLSHIPKKGKILDPCIGKNIFFSLLDNKNLELHGIEIDKSLISEKTRNFYRKPNRSLIIGDFIEQDFLSEKFDAVIMNPPYTRQEKVQPKMKKKLAEIGKNTGLSLSGKANLYIYFVLKGLQLLKDGGIMIAITYDSWLYSAFGHNFKKFLLNHYNVKRIIHYKHDAFDGVDVGATIIVIKKERQNIPIEYAEYNSAKDFSFSSRNSGLHGLSPDKIVNFNDHATLDRHLDFSGNKFQNLEELSEVKPWRGASSPSNKYFLFKHKASDLTPVLKKVHNETLSVSREDCIYAFTATGKNYKKRLDTLKQELLKGEVSESLKHKIKSNPNWYKFPIKPGGEIIFNYYFRERPRFILNHLNIPTMGNFYNISCPKYKFETFALLNSSLTRHALIRDSKSQGKGLRKIQLYKFNKVRVLKLDAFSKKELGKLRSMGKALTKNDNKTKTLLLINELVLQKYCAMTYQKYTNVKNLLNK